MINKFYVIGCSLLLMSSALVLAGCGKVQAQSDANAATIGLPPPAQVVMSKDPSLFSVDRPDQFPLAAATAQPARSEMVVTGTVTPDVSRNVPVASLASGRVMTIHAKLGDTVQKGQVLMTIRSDDISGGYSTYKQASADETLALAQLERAKDLYEHGAIALNDLQMAQDTEAKAKVVLEVAAEHLKLLGNDPDKLNYMVDLPAPVSGVITDQQTTVGATVQSYSSPFPFTISDLSTIWVVCDVYENDLATVKIGDSADIMLNAYPDRMFKGRVSNILPTLDPNIRTGKVRIEVRNPGFMRLGMFVRATFHSQSAEMHTIVPASAVLHMHDRDFVFVPAENKQFRRVEVVSGDLVQDNTSLQEIKSGLEPGQQVVSNALVLDHVLAQ